MHDIWKDMFVLGLPIAEKILRPVIVYIFLIVGLRLSGKRELAQLNPFDLIVLLTLSNTVQNAIIGDDNSVTGGIIGATSLLAINYLVVRFLYDHRKIDQLVEGRADILVEDGKIHEHKLKRELITKEELAAAARKQGFETLAEVRQCVLEPGATLLGHRAHTEELLRQSQATDQWSYYQAKNIRFHEVQGIADLLGALAPADKKETAALREKYLKEMERYEADKEDISEKAKEFEKERDLISRRADRFDGGEALLEVGLVICSITLLTRRRLFWVGGVSGGAIGVLLAVTGLFLHLWGCFSF